MQAVGSHFLRGGYPKSRALDLHGDSVTNLTAGWVAPSALIIADDDRVVATSAQRTVGDPQFGRDTNQRKVLFRPFTGVAPRLYHRAFTKDRPLKDGVSGKQKFGAPEWGERWATRMLSYTDLEALLTAEETK